MKKQFLLSLMAMVLPLAAWAQGQFVVTAEDVSYAGTDTKANITSVQLKVGETVSDLEESQYTIVISKKGETTATTVKNVGDYTVTVTGNGLLGGYTAGTCDFQVTPKLVDGVKLGIADKVSKTYGEDDQDVLNSLVTSIPTGVLATNSDSEAERADFLKCLKVARYGQDSEGETAADYKVFVDGKTDEELATAGSNYKYIAPGAGQYATMTINKKALNIEMVWTRAYNGNTVNLPYLLSNNEASSVYTIKEDVGEDDVKVKALTYNGVIKDAGEYKLSAELDGDDAENYTVGNNGNIVLTISRVPLTITRNSVFERLEKMYGANFAGKDEDLIDEEVFEVTGFVNNENVSIIKMTMCKEEGEDVGDYKVYVYNDGEKVDNYAKAFTNYSLTYDPEAEANLFKITPKALEEDWLTVSQDIDLTYQGKAFEVDADDITVTYKKNVVEEKRTLAEGTDYTISVVKVTAAGENAVNAKETFKIMIKAVKDGNYSGSVYYQENGSDKIFTITQAPLAITPKLVDGSDNEYVTIGKTYGEDDPEDFTQYYDFTDFVNGETAENIGLTMVRQEGEDAGSYYVRLYKDGVQVKSADYGTKFGNYDVKYNVEGKETKFHIAKKALAYWAADAEKVYDGTAIAEGLTVTVGENALVGEDKLDDIFTKKPVVEVVFADDATVKEAKNVGEYTLAVTTEGTSKNYELTCDKTKTGKYEITKRDMTITAPTKDDIAFGAEITDEMLATWAQWDNGKGTIIANFETGKDNKGLEADRKTVRDMIWLTLTEEAKAGATGTHQGGIVVNMKKAEDAETDAEKAIFQNYEIELVNGDLIIGLVEELTLDARIVDEEDAEEAETDETKWSVAKKLAKYNGAKVKTVTIKNLTNNFIGDGSNYETDQTISPEKWYTLVLPFDVTVAELSYKFGYAIVNVPDVDNEAATGAGFKLTMQEVPANTLMAFKVAYEMKWEDIAGVEFEDKTIVAPSEDYEWATDKAGSEFRGVYTKQTIEGDDEFFWSAKTGRPTRAATVVNQKGHGVDVYPLNGYIKAASANARIYVQEADGSTTAINAVTGEVINSNTEGWYSVGGMKLNAQPTQKGIYINNGKMVVIK